MKKFVAVLAAAMGLCLLAGCSNLVGKDSGEFGSLTINGSETSSENSRKLVASELSIESVKVYGYNITAVNGNADSFVNGKGSATVEKIPVGRRVIEVKSNTGATLYAVKDIKAGTNEVTVNWGTTAVGAVYYELSKTTEIKNIEESEFTSAIDTTKHACLIDAAAIAADYKTGSLKAAANYVMETRTVTVKAFGYDGKVIQIADPSSEPQTVSGDEAVLTFADVCPGKWSVYADGKKEKTVNVSSDDATVTLGSSIGNKTIIFVKASSAPTIWVWESEGVSVSEVQGHTWATQPAMSAVAEGYMNDPAGWYMYDVTGVASGKQMTFKLNQGGENTNAACTKTFWFDGKNYYSSDPTTPVVPDDNTNLSDILINGNSIGTVTSYEVPYSTEKVTVSAVAESSKATVTVSPSVETALTVEVAKTFTITVTAETGDKKDYTLNVTRKDKIPNDVSITAIKVNGSAASGSGSSYTFSKTGSDLALTISSVTAIPTDSDATVTYSTIPSSVASGSPATVTITVKNGTGSATYTLTISYTFQETPKYYWTNKNGYGSNKTISGLSSWSEDDKIIQGVACDSPRCWLGGHEYPDPDLYAMFAAWDNTNLYLLIEIPNVDDAETIDNDKSYAGSQFLPMGIVMNTGKRTAGDGTLANGNSVWQESKLYSWAEGIDTMLMFHPRLGIGKPSIFTTDASGKFSYDEENCVGFAAAGVEREVYFNECVSHNMWAATVDEDGNWGGKSSTDMDSYTYVDYLAKGKHMSAYQITIPLSALGIDKAYLESTGISVGCFSTYGASTMDCLPWDPVMIDNAASPYSSDPSSSMEKEDADVISASLARIGK